MARTRRIVVANKQEIDDKIVAVAEYNEFWENGEFCQTLSRCTHEFPIGTSDEEIVEWVRINEYREDQFSSLEKTTDVYTYVEERRPPDYVRHVNVFGQRWEVIGICTNIGKCYEGAGGPKPELDCPIAPGFTGCCQFEIRVLN